jgi:putative peptidoglycan lipid II flippase
MRLLRSTAIIGSLTLVSRILGLVRDMLIATFLGAGVISDAFFTAFKLPNVFRKMFAEGAFNAAFIPLYARRLEEEGEVSADTFAKEAMSALLVVVAFLVIAFEVTMPWSLSIIGFGLDKAVDHNTGISPYYLAVVYAQITMPYLVFMSLTALYSGILNTRNHFALAAAVPIVLNLFMIITLFTLGFSGYNQKTIGYFLTIAITLSGFVQMSLVIWWCRKAGVKIGLKRPQITPGVKRLFFLGIPGLLAAGITQLNLLVSHAIATMEKSAASWLTYADRLYQLPLGIIGIAMGVALLPTLTRRLRSGDEGGAKVTLNRAVEIAAFFTIPAAFALGTIPNFLLGALFERGAFTAFTTNQVSMALEMFAYGLPAFVLLKVLTPAFFARENTKTPMIFAAISAVINVTLGLYLFINIGFQGLALATSVAGWVNVIALTLILRKNGHFTPDNRLLTRVPRIIIASAIMSLALSFVTPFAEQILYGNLISDMLSLLFVCFLGLLVYSLSAALLRAFDLSDIRDALKRST